MRSRTVAVPSAADKLDMTFVAHQKARKHADFEDFVFANPMRVLTD